MSSIELHEGDNRVTLRRLIDQGVRVHSVVCDPPYGLVSITKRFGSDKAAPAKFGSDGAFQRSSRGFMGSKWDATGIERDPEFWALVHEILLPGGYCLAFSSPRTGHWQACAMELGGFIMHPFFGWLYGQGFPKAHSAERAVSMACCTLPGRHYANATPKDHRPGDHVCPEALDAVQWEGWAYGGQSVKPALEPIYIGQKPFSEKNGALNLLRHGVGALNIDACRVEGAPSPSAAMRAAVRAGDSAAPSSCKPGEYGYTIQNRIDPAVWAQAKPGEEMGRYPANLVHDGSDTVLACFPQSAGQLADANNDPDRVKTGRVYNPMRAGEASADRDYGDRGTTDFTGKPGARRADTGSAGRFFNAFEVGPDEWIAEPICEPVHYHAKATKADRAGSEHPTVKPIGLMRWLCRLATPPGGIVLDPFAGSGTTGAAASAEGFSCILMEADEKFANDVRRRFDLPCQIVAESLDADIEALIGRTSVELDLIG